MTGKKKHAKPEHSQETLPEDQVQVADVHARLIERPDGFYWQDRHADKLYGPFATSLEAMEDMQYQDDSDYEEGESLLEAEAEIGIADWIDPETGDPAEGSAPHLSDE
ncbi:MAG: hypothetical protein PHT15_07020 [Gallionellaceae bacterium]|nr:hypothetical protein [Gallionellaceae bacterium]